MRYLFSEYGPLHCGVQSPLERVPKPLEVVKNSENRFVAMSAMDDLLPAHFRLDSSCTPSRDSLAPPPSTPPQPYLSDLTNRFSPPSTSGAHHYATPESPISPLSLCPQLLLILGYQSLLDALLHNGVAAVGKMDQIVLVTFLQVHLVHPL